MATTDEPRRCDMTLKVSGNFKLALKWLVSLALLAIAISLLDLPSLQDSFSRLQPLGFLLIVGILLLEFPILGLRWHLLISPLVRTHTWNTLNHYFLGIFLNNFTPAQLGGDVYRYYVVKTEVLKRQEIVAALIQERLIGLVGFLLFFVSSLRSLGHCGR